IRALDRLAVERARDGLSRTRVRALQAIYLLDMYLRRLDGGHGEESPLTLKYRELLRHLDADLVACAFVRSVFRSSIHTATRGRRSSLSSSRSALARSSPSCRWPALWWSAWP